MICINDMQMICLFFYVATTFASFIEKFLMPKQMSK